MQAKPELVRKTLRSLNSPYILKNNKIIYIKKSRNKAPYDKHECNQSSIKVTNKFSC